MCAGHGGGRGDGGLAVLDRTDGREPTAHIGCTPSRDNGCTKCARVKRGASWRAFVADAVLHELCCVCWTVCMTYDFFVGFTCPAKWSEACWELARVLPPLLPARSASSHDRVSGASGDMIALEELLTSVIPSELGSRYDSHTTPAGGLTVRGEFARLLYERVDSPLQRARLPYCCTGLHPHATLFGQLSPVHAFYVLAVYSLEVARVKLVQSFQLMFCYLLDESIMGCPVGVIIGDIAECVFVELLDSIQWDGLSERQFMQQYRVIEDTCIMLLLRTCAHTIVARRVAFRLLFLLLTMFPDVALSFSCSGRCCGAPCPRRKSVCGSQCEEWCVASY